MTPSQATSPNPSLTELKRQVSMAAPQLSVGEKTPEKRTSEPTLPGISSVDTSEVTAKILKLEELARELSFEGILARKEDLENALFTLEKEHINSLASDSSYYEIKSKIIKELRKLDDKLAVLRAYLDSNKVFRSELPKLENSIAKIAAASRFTGSSSVTSPGPAGSLPSRQDMEASLGELTKKYLAGQLSEEVYYDLKAKLSVKLDYLAPPSAGRKGSPLSSD